MTPLLYLLHLLYLLYLLWPRRSSLGNAAPESTPPIPFESGHPYKRGVQDAKKKKGWGRGRAEEGREMELTRHEERHELYMLYMLDVAPGHAWRSSWRVS